ncbi:MAG: putative amidohydrolase YtcJ [Alcanivorax sp.]|jgi:predicted amidohydrolase YtcJ
MIKSEIHTVLGLIALSTVITACDSSSNPPSAAEKSTTPGADIVLTNGNIYTVNASQPWAEAVAISNGKYSYIGDAKSVDGYIEKNTRVIDLGGRMAMPGINDAHVHPMQGAMKDLYDCNFPFTATPDDIAAAVSQCVAEQPDAIWIRGGQWGSDFFVDYPIENPREWLDQVSGDKAVYLSDDALHNGWFNSKALDLLGVDRDTPNPPGVEILKVPATGEPNGILLEVFGFIGDALPERSAEEYLAAADYVVGVANRFGITGMKGASATDQQIGGFIALDNAGGMTAYYAASLQTPYGHREEPLDVSKLEARRDAQGSPHVDTRYVKLFMDGVPTASRTAAMLAPYLPETPDTPVTSGILHINEEVLTTDLIALDKAGFTVKIHTAGDRSVRVALNAIEAARAANGDSGLRHELSHAGYIGPGDIQRFAGLNAVAGLNPYIWSPSPIIQSVVNALGPRAEQYWPVKSLLESGAPVLAGSDWPAAAANMSPWAAIEALVTRADPIGDYPGKLWPEEAITLAQALEIFTLQSARALRLGERSGSVELGKSADLIVLNQHLFEVPIKAVSDTLVEQVLFEGQVVVGE